MMINKQDIFHTLWKMKVLVRQLAYYDIFRSCFRRTNSSRTVQEG